MLILTAKTGGDDLVTAMEAGADDSVADRFKSPELKARLRVGCRILELEERFQFTDQPPVVMPALRARRM